MNRQEFACLTCLDFRVLPDVGPCPSCRPAAYAEFVQALADDLAQQRVGVSQGGVAA